MRAGTVMATLMTYWIELETSRVLPVKPAMVKTYVMSDKRSAFEALAEESGVNLQYIITFIPVSCDQICVKSPI
jgi:hypothetical protein